MSDYFDKIKHIEEIEKKVNKIENVIKRMQELSSQKEHFVHVVIEENINNIHKRIDEIEKNHLVNSAEKVGHLGRALHTLSEENEKLETLLNRKWNENSELSKRLLELERCIDYMKENDVNRNTHYLSQFERIDEIVNLIKENNMRDRRKPHKCPVCDGYGKILSLIAQESNKCNACEGKGVIWG